MTSESTAGGDVSVDMGGDFGELTTEWGGTFEGDESAMSFNGEYEGILEDLAIDFSGIPLVFDVTYDGGFTTNRTSILPEEGDTAEPTTTGSAE